MQRLRARRSIMSMFSLLVLIGTFDGKSIFIKVKPGRNSMNTTPSPERIYKIGEALSGMMNTVKVVDMDRAIVTQNHAAIFDKM